MVSSFHRVLLECLQQGVGHAALGGILKVTWVESEIVDSKKSVNRSNEETDKHLALRSSHSMPSPERRVIRFRTRGLGAFSGGYMLKLSTM